MSKKIEIELPSETATSDEWFTWFIQAIGRLMAHAPPAVQQFIGVALAETNANHPLTAPLGTALLAQGAAAEIQAQNPPAVPSWVDEVVTVGYSGPECLCETGMLFCPRHNPE